MKSSANTGLALAAAFALGSALGAVVTVAIRRKQLGDDEEETFLLSPPPPPPPPAPSPPPAPPPPAPAVQSAERLRILVTGFNDWKDLSAPGSSLWRSRDNPSSRVILEEKDTPMHAYPPLRRNGPLVKLLEANGDHDYSFVTLPVTW